MTDGATAGYRYFEFRTAKEITAEVRGSGEGEFIVRDDRDGNVVSCISISPSEKWTCFSAPLRIESGKHALYFTFRGTGSIDFMSFRFC